MTDALLTWGCSYLLHSSLLIGALWAAERAGLLARLGNATQELLWRVALLGGLISASLPLLPAMPAPSAPAGAYAGAAAQVQGVAPVAAVAEVRPLTAEPTPSVTPQASAQLGALPLTAAIAPSAQDLALALVALWLAGALVMLTALGLQWTWLRRAVRRLPAVGDARWQRLARQLAAEFRVPLPALRHARPGWASPLLAPGRVLCLPAWCLDLPDDEARAVLGHELAHLRRRDPAWRLLAAAMKALLWPQALNRVALQRLDLLAELSCDAAAAAPQGQRLALAQSLLRCAEALKAHGGHHGPALACGAASAGSPLFARVRRLLKPAGEDTPRERRGVRWGLVAGMLALLVALPAVVVSRTDASELMDRFDVSSLLRVGNTHIVSRYPGGSFSVTLDGTVDFNDAEDDVKTLTGRLTVREREGQLTREMVLKSMGEERIERLYRVGRDSRPMDDAARQWWAKAVHRMADDLTDPAVRAQRLFARGGLEAVLADMERPTEDYPRRRRIEAALKLDAPMTATAQDRLIAVAAALQGAFERRQALSAIARLPLAEAQQVAWLRAVGDINGNFERREALASLAPRLLGSSAVLAAWGEALGRIDGDFELRTAIDTQVNATPQPEVLAIALQAATKLQGDFERREVLGAVARRLQGDEAALVQSYAQVASGISGGFERREALNRLLDRPKLSPAGLAEVLTSAEGMDGGFERLQVLLRVTSKLGEVKPVDPALIERLRRAGRGLGDHERGQIENALDRLG
jgi:beta-lactamase regulating signal transducer with metallopeptidase domain